MLCSICKGDLKKGKINFPLDLKNQFVLIKDVPADICQQCSEYFLNDEVAAVIEKIAAKAKASNVEIEVLKYAA